MDKEIAGLPWRAVATETGLDGKDHAQTPAAGALRWRRPKPNQRFRRRPGAQAPAKPLCPSNDPSAQVVGQWAESCENDGCAEYHRQKLGKKAPPGPQGSTGRRPGSVGKNLNESGGIAAWKFGYFGGALEMLGHCI